MVRDGQLMSNRRGSYALVEELELVRGSVRGHKEGYGYLITITNASTGNLIEVCCAAAAVQ